MKTTVELNLKTKLSLSPQLQQAIYLLQLSSIDLAKELEKAVEKNPLLELDDYPKTFSDTSSFSFSKTLSHDEINLENIKVETEDLRSHLLWQLNLTPMSERDQIIATTIIDCINNHGYLDSSLKDIILTLNANTNYNINENEVKAILLLIQQFEPIGVGARNLQECLLIQLEQIDINTPYLNNAKNIIKNHIHLLGQHKYQALMNLMHVNKEQLDKIIKLIQRLNPHPGDVISPPNTTFISPDLTVFKDKKGHWAVKLNSDNLPILKINENYHSLTNTTNKLDHEYIKQNLQEARWLLKSLSMRNLTLLKVANYIVKFQKNFFTNGTVALKPLTLNNVATSLKLHESTISRITTQKYLYSPQGLFELKYFFSSHVTNSKGHITASKAIQALIKQILDNENPSNPLSDQSIANFLQKQGINIARRTITKYRKILKIPPANLRKNLTSFTAN